LTEKEENMLDLARFLKAVGIAGGFALILWAMIISISGSKGLEMADFSTSDWCASTSAATGLFLLAFFAAHAGLKEGT